MTLAQAWLQEVPRFCESSPWKKPPTLHQLEPETPGRQGCRGGARWEACKVAMEPWTCSATQARPVPSSQAPLPPPKRLPAKIKFHRWKAFGFAGARISQRGGKHHVHRTANPASPSTLPDLEDSHGGVLFNH